jgi:uncharacterized protein (DUF362 family)
MEKTKVAKIKVKGRGIKKLKRAIARAVGVLGGFERFIKKGEAVLLKPNFNTDDPFPASTAMDFLEAVIDLVYKCKPKAIIVGDSSTLSMNTRKVMERKGLFRIARRYLIKVYNFDEYEWRKKIVNGIYLKKARITEFVDKVDRIILLPCLKTHKNAQLTASLKLSVGFLRPIDRIKLHFAHLEEKVAELNTLIKPDLIIMDARKCFIAGGPARGIVRNPGYILASTDRIAIDVEGAKIIKSFKGNSLQSDPWQLPQIKRAIQLGLGAKSEADYEVVKLNAK